MKFFFDKLDAYFESLAPWEFMLMAAGAILIVWMVILGVVSWVRGLRYPTP